MQFYLSPLGNLPTTSYSLTRAGNHRERIQDSCSNPSQNCGSHTLWATRQGPAPGPGVDLSLAKPKKEEGCPRNTGHCCPFPSNLGYFFLFILSQTIESNHLKQQSCAMRKAWIVRVRNFEETCSPTKRNEEVADFLDFPPYDVTCPINQSDASIQIPWLNAHAQE